MDRPPNNKTLRSLMKRHPSLPRMIQQMKTLKMMKKEVKRQLLRESSHLHKISQIRNNRVTRQMALNLNQSRPTLREIRIVTFNYKPFNNSQVQAILKSLLWSTLGFSSSNRLNNRKAVPTTI
jgi:type II secretory pathway predicted ATPase ExeA